MHDAILERNQVLKTKKGRAIKEKMQVESFIEFAGWEGLFMES